MKILFYSLYANFLPPFGTQLELMKREKDAGNEIFVVRCKGVFLSCHANLEHHPVKCARCIDRSDFFFKQLGIPESNIYSIETSAESAGFLVPYFHNTDELLNFKYKGFELGRGVASTLISRSRELEIDSLRFGELIDIYLRMAIDAFESLQKIIDQILPDLVVLYNGRQPEDRPLVLLAEQRGIKYASYVAGSNIQKFRIFKNGVVHYLHSFQQHINELLLNHESTPEIIEIEGAKWFDRVAESLSKDTPNYTKSQQKGLLPVSFNRQKINIAIFNSSEDEMKTFQDWKTPLYQNQNEAIRKICEIFKDKKDIQFYLRIHPNLQSVLNTQMQEINSFNFQNLEIIPADSPVNTYSLMDACDKVITFGSSTGAEATHRGKPSILIGKSFYDHLDCVYKINDYHELLALIIDKNLKPKPAFNARKYGFYLSNHGEEHLFLEFREDGHYFNNQKLEKIRFGTVIRIMVDFYLQTSKWLKIKRILNKIKI
jgi:hypothetical protein